MRGLILFIILGQFAASAYAIAPSSGVPSNLPHLRLISPTASTGMKANAISLGNYNFKPTAATPLVPLGTTKPSYIYPTTTPLSGPMMMPPLAPTTTTNNSTPAINPMQLMNGMMGNGGGTSTPLSSTYSPSPYAPPTQQFYNPARQSVFNPMGRASSPYMSPSATASSYTPTSAGRPAGTSSGPWDRFRCPGNGLSGTFYNLPYQDKPNSWGSYRMFFDAANAGSSSARRGAVNVEGSGILRDGRVIDYTGRIRQNKCPSYFGEPSVSSGATGSCLVPFFSVAADLSVYPAGTIIKVPEIAGQTVYLPPNALPIKHPGYFIVGDTGSAIKGQNRFDFFTGSYEQRDKANVFGNSSTNRALRMDLHSCNKTVEIIKPHDSRYAEAKRTMDEAIASASGSARGPAMVQANTAQ